jgi:hypothetical protein
MNASKGYTMQRTSEVPNVMGVMVEQHCRGRMDVGTPGSLLLL